jgi:hypothetical protein
MSIEFLPEGAYSGSIDVEGPRLIASGESGINGLLSVIAMNERERKDIDGSETAFDYLKMQCARKLSEIVKVDMVKSTDVDTFIENVLGGRDGE